MPARRPGATRALLLLLWAALSACAHDPSAGPAVARARERDATIAAALVVLFVVAGRLAAYAGAREDVRRWPPRPAALPPLLVASAVASQLTALLLLGIVGGYVGYFLPAPVEGAGSDAYGFVLALVVAAPLWVAAVAGAAGLFVVARRLPQVGTAVVAAAAAGHALAAVLGVVLAVAVAASGGPLAWSLAGGALALVSAAGAVGYARGLRLRQRAAR